MKKTKKRGIGNTLALTAAATIAGSSLLWATAHQTKIPYPTYTVEKVEDGDTFYLTNGLKVRLANIDAPEPGLCGSAEAKHGLETLVLGKPVYLYITAVDQYDRLVSMVYTDTDFVNEQMLRRGLATYPSSTKGYADILRNAVDEARQYGRGIHGRPCTQKVNTEKPSCSIKGNIKDGNNYYYPPDCPWYAQAYVQLYLGEQWFCSEKEAKDAGYTIAPRCR